MPTTKNWLVTLLSSAWFLSLSTPAVAFVCPLGDASKTPLYASSATTTGTIDEATSGQTTQSLWLKKGLLLSSFTDGLKSTPKAVDWTMNALVESLWEEEQKSTQAALQESNLASPCNGPDPVLLGQLEDTDRVVDGLTGDWKKDFELLCRTKATKDDSSVIDLRVLYIPTAMYALRPGSTSTPGKQRGRNRADGKKRRNEILQLLQTQLQQVVPCVKDTTIAVRAVTMDFDDASVKQPEEIVVNGSETEAGFPKTGKEAIRDWKPHLIYVQGGNTFWLYHCMEKGDWTKDLIDACCYQENYDESSSSSSFSAVYCGVSAGAILAGESMQTACWKEWDDPSVVPGMETYEDWTDVRGLDGAGRCSVFPHMTDEWQELTERKTKQLLETVTGNDDEQSSSTPTVHCVRDDQAYTVDGRRRIVTELI